MAWITSRWDLPARVLHCEKLVLSPNMDVVLPHLRRIEVMFDVMLACGEEPRILTADVLGRCEDGRLEMVVAPYGGSHIQGLRKLPIADALGKPIPTRIEKREYVGGVETVIDMPDARYHVLR